MPRRWVAPGSRTAAALQALALSAVQGALVRAPRLGVRRGLPVCPSCAGAVAVTAAWAAGAHSSGEGGLTRPWVLPQEELFIKFAQFEEKCREPERARAIFKFALDHIPRAQAQNVYERFIAFEKQHGDRSGIEAGPTACLR